MIRTLYRYNHKTDEHFVVATFEMDGKKLKVEWEPKSEWQRRSLEEDGIVAQGKVLFPKDGRAFFDALPSAYANSSTSYVKDA